VKHWEKQGSDPETDVTKVKDSQFTENLITFVLFKGFQESALGHNATILPGSAARTGRVSKRY
jgi:hypothetical protein